MRKEYYQEHKKEIIKRTSLYRKSHIEQARESTRKYHLKCKLECLVHYSTNPPKCACCGESEIRFLSIDHINGGGTKHRRQIGIGGGATMYLWLKKNNYPKGFQVLCYNCNMAKGFYGICPHKEGE